MANKNFQNYAVAGNNVALTYDNVNDTVTIDVNVDKNDVGLGNVDNTSDIDKPISTLVQNALNLKEGVITAGTTAQYYRGDKTFQTLDKTAVGLSNVDNTSDANKPISTATQTALNGKQATISLTTTGSSGASTFAANVLNIPTYSLSGLGGQPLATNLTSISALTFASTSFVKMTAAGTFALDTNTYLTAESDTLASVTGRGNTTTNAITVGGLTVATNLIVTDTVNKWIGIKRTPGVELDVSGDIRASSAMFMTKTQTNSIQTNGSNLTFKGSGAATYGTMFLSTGNFLLQNEGTFTDSGFRLDVNGTVRIQNQLTTTGSITAASAIARGVYMNQTLVAAANNDVLVGLDINTTFTTGAFTGVRTFNLRLNSGMESPIYSSLNNLRLTSGATTQPINFYLNLTSQEIARFHATTGNLTLQNGGTFTDAGYRLDVVGTARIQGATTITPDAVTGTLATSSLDIAQTWNTTGTPIALKVNVTDTASGNLSDLISLRVGGVDKFRVVKSGYFVHSSSGEINGVLVVGSNSYNAASQLEVTSTSRGFLPPRMTTTQKNAIATPPGGLIVYDTTLGKLCMRGASAWETITSV